MLKKIPFVIAIICMVQYFNQGISSLPDQAIYYLLRESWGLSATKLGLISWVVGIAWYLKIIFGYCVDNVSIRGKRTTYYIMGSMAILLVNYAYIIMYGLNLTSLIVTSILINICIAFSDVCVDREMVIAEKKYKLKSRLQALQWASLGIAGLIVAIFGAVIAKYIPEPFNYKIGFVVASIVPIIMLVYMSTKFKEEKLTKKSKFTPFKTLKNNFKKITDKRLVLGLIFIACLQFCPSFGTALTIKLREVMKVDKLFLGYLGAMGTVLGVFGYFLYYKWAYKFPIKKMLYFAVVFSAITNLFYLYIPNKGILVIYNLVFGAFGGITFMTLLAFFVKIIPSGSEAFYYALVTSVSNFCSKGGNFFGGIIFDNYGYNVNVIVSSVATLCCLLLIPYLKLDN